MELWWRAKIENWTKLNVYDTILKRMERAIALTFKYINVKSPSFQQNQPRHNKNHRIIYILYIFCVFFFFFFSLHLVFFFSMNALFKKRKCLFLTFSYQHFLQRFHFFENSLWIVQPDETRLYSNENAKHEQKSKSSVHFPHFFTMLISNYHSILNQHLSKTFFSFQHRIFFLYRISVWFSISLCIFILS